MKDLRSHFWYSKSQRNGILFLVSLIIVAQLIYVFVDFKSDDLIIETEELNGYQRKIDSLKSLKINKQPPKIFPFNPNYLTDFKAYQLGLSIYEIDNLFNYRKSGKFINSAADFQKVTMISDSLLAVISPYFKFPDWINNKKNKKVKSVKKNSSVSADFARDINLATEVDLQRVRGIGEKLAKRIVSYRNLLGGFSFDDQLYEVYYLDKEVADRLLASFKVFDRPVIQKLNLNTADFKEVLKLPYIDYKLTVKLFDYRNSVPRIDSLEELKKIDSFPLDKYDRITLYLLAE